MTVALGGPSFTITQNFSITLAGHSVGSYSIQTGVNPVGVPEPSSMAIAGLGALGMIGYGLRRRKALGA